MMNTMNVKRLLSVLSVTLLVFLGCARVRIDSKDPIKLDVTMRLDIYQHVTKDVDSIENLISGPAPEGAQRTSFFALGVKNAYAQEEGDFPADVLQAIEARKARRDKLIALEAQGVIGENLDGLVALRGVGGDVAEALVSDENRDRRKIYEYVARKNSVSYQETARISAKRIQSDAPSGTPVETAPGAWSTK